MDVLLVQPRDPSLDKLPFDTITSAALDLPPLSLLYLGSVLKEKGFSVKVIDCNAFGYKEQSFKELRLWLKHDPAVVGISAMTPTFPAALQIAEEVKKTSPGSTVVLGGHHVTFMAEEALKTPYVDYVIRGEGEMSLAELVIWLAYGSKKRDRLGEIVGLSYRDESGSFKHTAGSGLVMDLDALPYPDRSLVDIDRYRNPSSIISSRGCPARCIFCAAGAFPVSKYRVRSPENVVDEMAFLKEHYRFGTVSLVDNTFTGLRERSNEICDLIIDRQLRVTWICETRVNVIDKDLLRKMAQAGCVAIQFGVESGNQDILRRIKKGIRLEWVEEAVDLCLRIGIKPGCSFMIGLPYDTPTTVKETIEFAKKLREKGCEVFFGIATPYPGTELFANREQYGIRIVDWDYTKWDTVHAVIETAHFSQRALEEMFIEAVTKIYATMEVDFPPSLVEL